MGLIPQHTSTVARDVVVFDFPGSAGTEQLEAQNCRRVLGCVCEFEVTDEAEDVVVLEEGELCFAVGSDSILLTGFLDGEEGLGPVFVTGVLIQTLCFVVDLAASSEESA